MRACRYLIINKMKRYLILALVLLVGCKNNTPPSRVEFDYTPDDLEELRNSPVHVDLSKYEAPEEDRNAMITPAKRDAEERDDVIHIRYDRPIKGYSVTADLYDNYFAEVHFKKGNSGFSVEITDFYERLLDDPAVGENDGKETVLPYVPVTFGKKISTEGTFGFFDVDFDGQDELIYVAFGQGSHGCTAFQVFELDGTEREDEPFDWSVDEFTEFNRSEKSITLHRYSGLMDGGDIVKYKRQPNGSFQVTDSTGIIYGVKGNLITDSIRLHYRRQGDEMVLVKKEVVK